MLPSIDSVVKNVKNLKEEVANFLDSTRQTTKIIEEMVSKTRFTFQINEKNPDKIESKIEIFPDGKSKFISERDVFDSKDKAIMLLASSNSVRDKDKIKNIPSFLEICKNFEILEEKEQKLVDWGYRHFSPEPLVVEVSDAKV